LSVNVETNLLSLVSPWLHKFCQITTKSATETLPQKISHLNTPSAYSLHLHNYVCRAIKFAETDAGLRLTAVGTLKRYSKALEYEYRVKTATLGTLKRYSIFSLTLYLEWYNAYSIVGSDGPH
jgi:hypothetical protein